MISTSLNGELLKTTGPELIDGLGEIAGAAAKDEPEQIEDLITALKEGA